MEEKELSKFTQEELLNPNFIPSIFENYQDEKERTTVLNRIIEVAKEERVYKDVIKAINKQSRKYNKNPVTINNFLVIGKGGEVEVTTTNFYEIMEHDKNLHEFVYYDEFKDVIVNTKTNKLWTDRDDANLRCYIEETYNIHNIQKCYDAFDKYVTHHKRHPLKELIESEVWDGKPRIDMFLTNVLGCENDDYHREVSRMIFYGGINRLYHPGCKFDYMPILIGKQGCGKSSLVRWLGLDDEYFKEIITIEGKDGMEALHGSWMCEMAELLAMVRTKEVEAMKSFITRQIDKYRPSYGRRSVSVPRTCIFIGTTNDYEFLTDKTGNRRYLPIVLNVRQGELFGREKQIKKYIRQCWAEALRLMTDGETYLTIPLKYLPLVEEQQELIVQDDPKVGIIQDYLDKKEIGDTICIQEIACNCLGMIKKKLTTSESKEIGRILRRMGDWEKSTQPLTKRFDEYGVQKFWIKIDPRKERNWNDLD